ncbi:MAG: hypothetical protein DCF28_09635 [Alphaproteobacteria bacterium]|nr:MAG: hypothetical protein DCF28_09635 [Alphaproteobacteria bacterium]PZO34921.1 MAG: hypothetical protein DCE92_11315 [Alphaproteobacteria bacterium]
MNQHSVMFLTGATMSRKPSASTIRLLVGIMIGASMTLIGIAVWMIVTDQGAPVFVALAGSLLGSAAAIIASQANKKS